MTDSEMLAGIRADVSRLNDALERHMEAESKRWEVIQPMVAVLKNMAHSSPCEPLLAQVGALKEQQDQAKGAMRFIAFMLAIIGGAAALVAIFK